MSDVSDLLSRTTQINSRLLLTQSLVSDVYALASDLNSDLRSLLTVTGVQLNASSLSDIRSAIGGVTVNLTSSDISDIASAVAAAVTTITASDISDIASAVKAILASDLSDVLSAAVQANSRALVIQSLVSDVDSALTSRFSDLLSHVDTTGVGLNASALSDLRSAITAAAVSLDASTMSNIASQVWAHVVGTRVDSRVFTTQSVVNALTAAETTRFTYTSNVLSHLSGVTSDIYSLLSDVRSDFQSRVPAAVATRSQVSDLASDLKSYLTGMSSLDSNIYSLLLQVQTEQDSQFVGISGMLSDVDSALTSQFTYESGMLSDLGSRIPGPMLTRAQTFTELTGAPGANPTQEEALQFLFMAQRNRSRRDAASVTVENDAGSIIASALLDYDTGASLFTRGEFA